MSEFNEALRAQEEKNKAVVNGVDDYFRYADHLYQISADPEGEDPERLLDDARLNILGDFIELAKNNDYINSEPADLRVRRTGRDAWKRPKDAGFSAIELSVAMKPIWEGRSYKIGSLVVGSLAAKADLIVCDDGLLRAHRHPKLFVRSKARGYGALPADVSNPNHTAKAEFIGKNPNDPKDFAINLAKIIEPDRKRNKPSGFV